MERAVGAGLGSLLKMLRAWGVVVVVVVVLALVLAAGVMVLGVMGEMVAGVMGEMVVGRGGVVVVVVVVPVVWRGGALKER